MRNKSIFNTFHTLFLIFHFNIFPQFFFIFFLSGNSSILVVNINPVLVFFFSSLSDSFRSKINPDQERIIQLSELHFSFGFVYETKNNKKTRIRFGESKSKENNLLSLVEIPQLEISPP